MELLRLKEILKEKGITGKELAEKVGVTPVAISNITSGNSFPKGDLLKAIAEALGVSVKDLFTPGEDEEAIYIKRDDKFIKVGEIKLNNTSNR